MSVLFPPFAELDLDEAYGAPPEGGYFADLIDHLENVERELDRVDPGGARHVIARSATDLELAGRRIAFVHCVESGVHLGATPDAVAANVAELARRGVGYITLAHLFYRQVATNANALPMLSDRWYSLLFRQPRGGGLSALGEAAVRAMHEHRVMVDLSHMRADAMDATFDLLERLDREHNTAPDAFPVLASHAGWRFGSQHYMLDRRTVERIQARDGVIGLILARHQLQDGLRDGEGLEHTVTTLRRHIDRIAEVTGSHRHVGIGSDLDGFIKPTMSGVEAAPDLAALERRLREVYGADADALLHDNARRVVARVLSQRVTVAPAPSGG